MNTATALPPPPPDSAQHVATAQWPQAVTPFPPPTVPEVLAAMGGFALLGLAAGLGSGIVEVALRSLPGTLVVAAGTAVLATPALLVAHQLLRFSARPEDLVGALSGAFVQVGRVALGLVPVMLFFAATSGLWTLTFGGVGLLLVTVAASSTSRRLRAVEPRGAVGVRPQYALLVLGWQVLAFALALRLAGGAVAFVLAPLVHGVSL